MSKTEPAFKLFGIFGYPLSHTLSPAMHEAGFCALGVDANYLVLELTLPDFKKAMAHKSQILLSGFNVTVPYKETVMSYLDKISPEARAIGAVNTVYRQGRRWVGTNTDMEGFLLTLRKDGKFLSSRKSAVVLGAGGACRAVVYGLSREGAREILIVDCFPEKAQKIVREMRRFFPQVRYAFSEAGNSRIKEAIEEADIIVNATPLGLKKEDPRVVPEPWIPPSKAGRKLFMDLIYNPAETPFLKTARRRGHRTLNGLGMLLYQGARAFELWTGKRAPVPVMRQALLRGLEGKGRSS